jgi:hypothetical protein
VDRSVPAKPNSHGGSATTRRGTRKRREVRIGDPDAALDASPVRPKAVGGRLGPSDDIPAVSAVGQVDPRLVADPVDRGGLDQRDLADVDGASYPDPS